MEQSSKYVKRHHACLKCNSSDAAVTYSDGMTHCFSCNSSYGSQQKTTNQIETKDEDKMEETVNRGGSTPSQSDLVRQISDSYDTRGFAERLITKEVAAHFGVRVGYDSERNISDHYYPYTSKGRCVGWKVRSLPKTFRVLGQLGDELFGQAVAQGSKVLVITEGELDAMAVAQAWKTQGKPIYPVVSLASASDMKAPIAQRDWLRSFGEVVLLLDSDEAGQKATEKLARIIGIDRVKIGTLKEKDASDALLSDPTGMSITRAIWDAQPYSPAGIVQGEDLWTAYQQRLATVSVPYPDCMRGINEKTKGMRMGEITLFTSGTGSGKSTLIKEIILNLLYQSEDKIGLVSLEESIGDTTEKLITMVCRKKEPTPDEARAAFDKIVSADKLLMLDHQGSVSDQSLTDKIEELCLLGCKYIILDHLTIAVSEGAEGLEGNAATDKVMSDLLKICKQHNVWLGVISHLRKAAGGSQTFEEGKLASMDDIKGSGSIKQISFDIIAFARNLVAEDETERNTIRMRVLKSRYTGYTGDAGSAHYDIDTTRLSYVDPAAMDFGVEL